MGVLQMALNDRAVGAVEVHVVDLIRNRASVCSQRALDDLCLVGADLSEPPDATNRVEHGVLDGRQGYPDVVFGTVERVGRRCYPVLARQGRALERGHRAEQVIASSINPVAQLLGVLVAEGVELAQGASELGGRAGRANRFLDAAELGVEV